MTPRRAVCQAGSPEPSAEGGLSRSGMHVLPAGRRGSLGSYVRRGGAQGCPALGTQTPTQTQLSATGSLSVQRSTSTVSLPSIKQQRN